MKLMNICYKIFLMILNADNRTLTIFDFRNRHDSTAWIFRLLFRFLVLLLDQDKHCNYLFPSELLWFLIFNVLMSLIVLHRAGCCEYLIKAVNLDLPPLGPWPWCWCNSACQQPELVIDWQMQRLTPSICTKAVMLWSWVEFLVHSKQHC